MNQNIFENESVPKSVMIFSIPTVLSMLVVIIYNLVDTFFIGKTGDPNQVAAVSLVMPVFLLLMSFGNMFGIGGSSLISRLLGEKKVEKVKNVSAFCFYGSIAVGIILMLLFLFFMPVIIDLIGTSNDTMGYAKEYLTYIAYGAVFVILANAFGNIIRAEGAARQSMFGMILGTVINIILDPVMIFTMNMGVAGAAVATIIGNIFSIGYYLLYFKKEHSLLSVNIRYFTIKNGVMSGVFIIGIPATINNILMSLSNIVLNNYLVLYSDIAVAAMGVAMKANILVVLIQSGLAMGVQPLIGYCYGARNFSRLKKVMKFTIICTVTLGTFLSVIYLLFTDNIIRVFINNADVIDEGILMLRALMLSGPVLGILFVFVFTFQAMGKAVPSLILSVSRQGLVFLPLLIVFNALFGVNGLIWAQPLADIASLIMAFMIFLRINKGLDTVETDEKEKQEYLKHDVEGKSAIDYV